MDDRATESSGTCVVPSGQDALKDAMSAHEAGRLTEAAALYAKVLADEETHIAALHLLGVVRLQQGDHSQAVELIGRAAALRPDVPVIQASLAEALLALGHYDLAVVRARNALRVGPNDASVRWILGQALQALGHHEDAARQLLQAVKLKPDFAEAYNTLGNAVRAVGGLEAAEAAFRAATRLAPELAAPHANLGSVLLQQARYTESLAPLERAVELQPGRAPTWEALADVLEALERFDAAIPCRERVLELNGGRRAAPLVALGRALRKENRQSDAEACLLQAVAVEPSSAVAHFHLGIYHEEEGDFAQAEVFFRDAIRLDPAHAPAHARLATLLRHALPDADFAALQERLADSEMASESRARVLFALGEVLDARGQYSDAAAAAREANAVCLTLARGDRRFRPEELDGIVDHSIRVYTPDFFAKLAGAGLDTPRPVFVVGVPRSGTTLIEQILASHPRVHGAGELPLARQVMDSLPWLFESDVAPIHCISRLDPIRIRGLAGNYFTRLQALCDPETERVVDKMPENYKYLGLLAALFPSATFIHCRRDLRDVALSCWMKDFLSVPWTSDPAHIATAFRAYLRLMDHWQAVLPAPIHHVDYEETVTDVEVVARRLIAALGLEWDPVCLEFHRTRRTIRTGSLHQVRQPVYRQSIGRWRHYEHDLADLFAALPEQRV